MIQQPKPGQMPPWQGGSHGAMPPRERPGALGVLGFWGIWAGVIGLPVGVLVLRIWLGLVGLNLATYLFLAFFVSALPHIVLGVFAQAQARRWTRPAVSGRVAMAGVLPWVGHLLVATAVSDGDPGTGVIPSPVLRAAGPFWVNVVTITGMMLTVAAWVLMVIWLRKDGKPLRQRR